MVSLNAEVIAKLASEREGGELVVSNKSIDCDLPHKLDRAG